MKLVVVGAGGHGQVVADILLKQADRGHAVVGFVDDRAALHGRRYLDLPVLGGLEVLRHIEHDGIVVAIGDNAARAKVSSQLVARGESLASAVHLSAQIGLEVAIDGGAMICAGAVVNTGTSLGKGAIVNTGATVDHHSVLGDFVHIAPGVHMGGEVVIGDETLVGIGSTVLPRIRVGRRVVVAGGAVVTRDVPDDTCVVGVPARALARTTR